MRCRCRLLHISKNPSFQPRKPKAPPPPPPQNQQTKTLNAENQNRMEKTKSVDPNADDYDSGKPKGSGPGNKLASDEDTREFVVDVSSPCRIVCHLFLYDVLVS